MGQESISDILIAGGSHVGLTLALSLDRLLGTTAGKVVNHADCSVMVVRDPAAIRKS